VVYGISKPGVRLLNVWCGYLVSDGSLDCPESGVITRTSADNQTPTKPNQMTINSQKTFDDSMRAAAIAKGYADVSVVQLSVQKRPGALDVGTWFVLSVKRLAGDEWAVLGRRRTQVELLTLISP
jgi:hypothetical protein